MTIETRKIGRYTYVVHNGATIAIMERSPFSGEYCYGQRFEENGSGYYRPPFTPTRRKSIKAAAKVVAAALV